VRLIGIRRLAAIAAAAAAAGLCVAASAASASASVPVFWVGDGQEAHQCTVIGSDQYGNQGVVCADLLTAEPVLGDPEVQAQVEIICQNPSSGKPFNGEEPCAEAHAYGALANAQAGAGYRYEWACGHSYGACSASRNIWPIGTQDELDYSSDCQTSLTYNYWAVVYGQGALTSIELPGSGKWVYLGPPQANDSGNQSSGHYQICG
jgi:hypothetical protein